MKGARPSARSGASPVAAAAAARPGALAAAREASVPTTARAKSGMAEEADPWGGKTPAHGTPPRPPCPGPSPPPAPSPPPPPPASPGALVAAAEARVGTTRVPGVRAAGRLKPAGG